MAYCTCWQLTAQSVEELCHLGRASSMWSYRFDLKKNLIVGRLRPNVAQIWTHHITMWTRSVHPEQDCCAQLAMFLQMEDTAGRQRSGGLGTEVMVLISGPIRLIEGQGVIGANMVVLVCSITSKPISSRGGRFIENHSMTCVTCGGSDIHAID